jgi:hypothetical protein
MHERGFSAATSGLHGSRGAERPAFVSYRTFLAARPETCTARIARTAARDSTSESTPPLAGRADAASSYEQPRRQRSIAAPGQFGSRDGVVGG